MADLGYGDLERGIEQAPVTYLPALLITIVQRCVRDRVFQPGGMQRVIANASRQASSEEPNRG